jgi:hypothetical protein
MTKRSRNESDAGVEAFRNVNRQPKNPRKIQSGTWAATVAVGTKLIPVNRIAIISLSIVPSNAW